MGTRGMGGGFPMELSKGPVPCVALGVPIPFLDPAGHLHPAISSPLPPRGSNTWARCAGTWRTWRQTRRPLLPEPTTAKIPLFFHALRGPPFRLGEHGEAPRTWLFSKPGPHMRTQAPPPQASLGSRNPLLRGHVTHPCGVLRPTLQRSRDPPLRGIVTHPLEVMGSTLDGSRDPPLRRQMTHP